MSTWRTPAGAAAGPSVSRAQPSPSRASSLAGGDGRLRAQPPGRIPRAEAAVEQGRAGQPGGGAIDDRGGESWHAAQAGQCDPADDRGALLPAGERPADGDGGPDGAGGMRAALLLVAVQDLLAGLAVQDRGELPGQVRA
jgi:hypothetical protein